MDGIAAACESFWRLMLAHLWQTSLVWLALAALALALRRAPGRYANVLAWIALAKLFLPLALLGAVSGRLLGPALAGSADGARPGLVFFERVVLGSGVWPAADLAAGGPAGSGVHVALTLLWAGGALLLAVRWARRAAAVRGAGGIALEGLDAATRARLDAALHGTALPADRLRISRAAITPAVCGLLRSAIVVPERVVLALSAAELRAVLLHEEAHRRRRDPLLAALARLALALFFFYPPLWWLVRRLRESAELACDEAVLAAGVTPRTYGRALARAVGLGLRPLALPAAVGLGGLSGLAARLTRIRNSWRYEVMPRHRVTLGLALVLVLGASGYPLAEVTAADPPAAGAASGAEQATRLFPELDRLAGGETPVLMNFREIPLGRVLEAVGAATGTRVRIDGPGGAHEVDAVYSRRPVREVLVSLARQHGLSFEVPDPGTLVVRTPWLAGSGGVTSPRILPETKVEPVYPEAAREARLHGRVILQAVVRRDGSVDSISVLREAPRGHGFADSAREAVSRWRYDPGERDGLPVDVWFSIVVSFEMEGGEPVRGSGPIVAAGG